jgi:hypothetical protein
MSVFISTSPLEQVLCPVAWVVEVAGVVITQGPHSSLGIACVAPVQASVFKPGALQVGSVVTAQLVTQAELLELITTAEDEETTALTELEETTLLTELELTSLTELLLTTTLSTEDDETTLLLELELTTPPTELLLTTTFSAEDEETALLLELELTVISLEQELTVTSPTDDDESTLPPDDDVPPPPELLLLTTTLLPPDEDESSSWLPPPPPPDEQEKVNAIASKKPAESMILRGTFLVIVIPRNIVAKRLMEPCPLASFPASTLWADTQVCPDIVTVAGLSLILTTLP